MTNKTDLEKATDIVYGIQWTEDKTLVARIAEALAVERASLPESIEHEINRVRQLCVWLSQDSKKYPSTDAGNAAKPHIHDLDKALAELKAWQSGEVGE